MNKINRRSFLKLSALSSFFLAMSPSELLAKLGARTRTRSFEAFNGPKKITDVEIDSIDGQIPADLKTTLFKVSTGHKEKFGVNLNHFFDGDAFAFKIDFNHAKVRVRSKLIETPEYLHEQLEQKFIYDEFGTKATGKRKNNPSINIIPWGENFLALSESGLPSLLDRDLNFLSYHNFNGTIDDNFSFSAHPKFDPLTGELYTYGIVQGPTLSLKIFKIDPRTDRATEIYSSAQWRYFMIHDMVLTPNYVVLVIPPATASVFDLLNPKKTMAENIKFDKNRPTRILVVPKNTQERPFEIKIPPCMVFHNAHGFEENGNIIFYSLLSKDGSLLEVIRRWGEVYHGSFSPSALTRLEIDVKRRSLIKREELLYNHEFPSWNPNVPEGKNRYLYLTEMGERFDPYHFRAISKFDCLTGTFQKYRLSEQDIVGEVLFYQTDQQSEDAGHLIYNGYDTVKKCSFVEVLHAKDLSFISRVNLTSHLPVGLHGCLV